MKKFFLLLCFCLLTDLVFPQIFKKEEVDIKTLFNQGDWTKTITECEKRLKKFPEDKTAKVLLGRALVKNKQYREAENRMNAFLQNAKHDLDFTEILAEAEFYLGKNGNSLSHFEEYAAYSSESAARYGASYYYMGEIYIRLSMYQHADMAFSTAVYIEPLLHRWWARLGYAREMAKNYTGALEAYSEAVRLDGTFEAALKGLERVSKILN